MGVPAKPETAPPTGTPARVQADPRWSADIGALSPQQLRLLAKVARMYHERGMRQPQIAAALSMSQPRVSRMLKQAAEVGIVRTVVTVPPGAHTDLEDEIQQRFGLRDVVVVDTGGSTGDILPALGSATAGYLEATLTGGDRIGISSWSATLLAAVDVMQPTKGVAESVVQLVGGMGNSGVQFQATRLTGRLADLTSAQPVYVASAGLVSSPAVRRAIAKDAAISTVTGMWPSLTVALLGIGSTSPSPLLRQSGNAVAEEEQAELRALGAVGDVCLRFFDADGRHVRSPLDDRVVGIRPSDLRRIPRRIAVAGGGNKYPAIRGALLGGWVNTLITDLDTATQLAHS